ncbi:MAG: hypothetical protein DI539_07640 [Flavobacterium psychrophilum]|nr:MAG: hypothetical protein DI539_07640 [Flavobacterium psychrophilum]
MKMDKKFNILTFKEYFYYIENYKKYTDFNVLGLYRSLDENKKLDTDQKIEVRDYAHTFFKKQFDFLQIKDPSTYVKVISLGQELTVADKYQLWDDVRAYQEKTLKDKRIRHRNFGVYSKHDCGYENCRFNGLMIQQGSWLAEMEMRGTCWYAKVKSEKIKSERKNSAQIIKREIDFED